MRTFLLFLSITLYSVLTAQDTTPLTVGLVARAPYAFQDEQGNWAGIAVELWRQVAEREQLTYTLREVAERDSLLPLVGRQVDVLLQAPVTTNGTREVDYLHPYHDTTLAIAKPRQSSLWQVAKNVFSWQFFQIVLSLSVLLLIIGAAIYFLERKDNEKQFGGERTTMEGIGSGFWWAGVTLTTIGYGDKAPTTLAGRIIAMLWMLTALAITASLTAAVVSALDKGGTITFPDDLHGKRVGVVAESQAEDYLRGKNIAVETFDGTATALRRLQEKELDYLVDNHSAIVYPLNDSKALAADVQRTPVRPQALAIAVEKDSPLRDRLEAANVGVILSESWRQTLKRYGVLAKEER